MKTGLSREDIMNKIEETINGVDGMLTPVGAALVLSDKLKVEISLNQLERGTANREQDRLTIKELIDRMQNVVLFGRVASKTSARTFQRQDGRKGAVASLVLIDETGSIKVNLWDQKAALVDDVVKVGEIIGVYNAYTRLRNGNLEMHLDNRGTLKPKPDGLDEKAFPQATPVEAKKIHLNDLNANVNFLDITVKIIEKFTPRTFQRDGMDKQVARVQVADETGKGYVVFWTERMDDYHKLELNSVYDFLGLGVKANTMQQTIEMHVNRGTQIIPSKQSIDVAIPATSTTQSITGVIDDFTNVPERGDNLSVKGTVVYKSDVSSWNKNGRQGSVARLKLIDENNRSLNAVFWTEAIPMFNDINMGDVVELHGFYAKINRDQLELNASREATVKKLGNKAVTTTSMTIGSIKDNQAMVSFEGRVHAIEDERKITLRDGTETRNINFTVVDETGAINVVAWREQVDLVKRLNQGDAVKLENVNTSFNNFRKMIEAKLTQVSKISKVTGSAVPALDKLPERVISPASHPPIQGSKAQRTALSKIEDNMRVEVLGRITHVSKFVNHYIACPQCNKKVTGDAGGYTCTVHGKVSKPTKRLIARLNIDDGTGNVSVTTIGNNTNLLFGLQEEDVDAATNEGQRDEIMEGVMTRLLLKPYLFRGRIKFNEFRSEFELIADGFTEVDFNVESNSIMKELESAS